MNDWLIRLVHQILTLVSGPLKEMLNKFAIDFRDQARKTPNPWDDIFADILCWVLQVD